MLYSVSERMLYFLKGEDRFFLKSQAVYIFMFIIVIIFVWVFLRNDSIDQYKVFGIAYGSDSGNEYFYIDGVYELEELIYDQLSVKSDSSFLDYVFSVLRKGVELDVTGCGNIFFGNWLLSFEDEFKNFYIWNGLFGWDTLGGFQWKGRIYNHGTMPFNNELQWYVNEGYGLKPATWRIFDVFTARNGILNITAHEVDEQFRPYIEEQKYTSGMIATYSSFSQIYGYFEMRAKIPRGQGLWPAFWLLPADGSWPPELNVMEVLGNDPAVLYNAVHFGNANKVVSVGNGAVVADTSTGFNTFGVDWRPDLITWYFNGQPVFQTPTPADMHKPMYMIVNLAVGGNEPGGPDETTSFPAAFQIDYIRAYTAKPPSGDWIRCESEP